MLTDLPPALASRVLVMVPGQITDPIDMGGFLALFLMRDFQDSATAVLPDTLSVEYAEVAIANANTPDGQALARALRDRTNTCDDLYGTTRALGVGGPVREMRAHADLAPDMAQVIAGLDIGEVSSELVTADGTLRFIMLCARVTDLGTGARAELRRRLFGQRLQSYANGLLSELRANAVIERPVGDNGGGGGKDG